MKKLFPKILALGLCIMAVFSSASARAENTEGSLSLLAINVRKADCLLLRSGASAYLIDTGTKDSADQVLALLAEEGVTRLDGIILTHTHADHAGGLKNLLASDLEIDALYASRWYTDIKEGKHPIEKALKKNPDREGIRIGWLSAGDTLPLDGGSLDVLGPVEESDKENCNSVVLLASAGGGTMLLTGDMEIPEEASLLAAGMIPKVDVIKIGNHGEEDATGPALIRACEPKVAVISTNTEDEKDTPHKRVIALLNQWNVAVYQTQHTGKGVLVTIRNGEIGVEEK